MPFRFKKPSGDQHPEGKIVPIATVDNQMVADMAIGILKMHHIPCMACFYCRRTADKRIR